MQGKSLLLIMIFCVSAVFAQAQKSNTGNYKPQVFDAEAYADSNINGIYLYFNPDCSRCAGVIQILTQENVPYKKIDVSDEKKYQEMDKRIYDALPQPGKGYSTRFPVIRINNTMYYNIQNHMEFVQDLALLYKEKYQ